MFKYIKKYIPLLVLITIIFFISNYFSVSFNILIMEVIDDAVSGLDTFNAKVVQILIYILLLFVTLVILDLLKAWFINLSALSIKSGFLKRIFKKNLNEFQNENNSKYMSTLTNDYDLIETNYLESIILMIDSIATFAAGIYLFAIIDPIIILITFGLMVINVIVSYFGSKPVNKHNEERSIMLGNYTAYIKEVLSAFHIIKTNNLQDKIKKDYYNKSEQVQKKGYVIDKIHSFIFALQNTNFAITFTALLLIIAYMSITGDITFGAVVLISQSSEKLIWPITNFTETLPKLMSVKSIIKRMDKSLENISNYEETIDFNTFTSKIELKDVKFAYDDNVVLDGANLEFQKGKKYLIVGPSGGGKSTVLRLLRKYFNPNDGEITIDGIPLKDIKKEQYFNCIANIEQNVFLFEDSIKNNLTLYKDYTEDEINDALKRAGLDEFIKSLPKGIETIIYDNGKNISGGERSRIAIARGLLNKSQIIILDEAFASLDYDRASEIEKSILNLENVTVINVSHVIIKENKDQYDQVYVVNKKKVLTLVNEE